MVLGKGLLIALVSVLAAAVLGFGGFFIATVLSEASFGSDVPALEAPATEAPMAEAPIAEAPAGQELTFGLLVTDPSMDTFVEQLMARLGQAGASFTVESNVVSPQEVTAFAEQMITRDIDVIVVQGISLHSEEGEYLSAITAACGIPLILLGEDPTYETGKTDIFDMYPNVVYVGADPRNLASFMVGCLTDLKDPDPDRNGNGSISYVFLGGESLTWENEGISEAIPETFEMRGIGASLLGEGYGSDCHDALAKVLYSYGTQVEVIFCTDAEAAETAYTVCQEHGIDVWNEVAIITLGDPEELQWMYEEGVLAGYVEYSRELLADAVAEVLVAVLRGEQLGDSYTLPCEIHFPETAVSGDKLMARVTAADLNIRSTPSTAGERVGSYNKGDTVEILEIQTVNGTDWGLTKDGWIVMVYVQIIE